MGGVRSSVIGRSVTVPPRRGIDVPGVGVDRHRQTARAFGNPALGEIAGHDERRRRNAASEPGAGRILLAQQLDRLAARVDRHDDLAQPRRAGRVDADLPHDVASRPSRVGVERHRSAPRARTSTTRAAPASSKPGTPKTSKRVRMRDRSKRSNAATLHEEGRQVKNREQKSAYRIREFTSATRRRRTRASPDSCLRLRREFPPAQKSPLPGRGLLVSNVSRHDPSRHEIAPAEGPLGVLLPGLGAVSTTFIAGVELIRKGRRARRSVRSPRWAPSGSASAPTTAPR